MMRCMIRSAIVLLVLLPAIFALPYTCGSFTPPRVPPVGANDVELQQVSIVFRHGDRIMYQDVTCWPNDQAVYNCQDTHLSTPSFLQNQTQNHSGRLFRKTFMEGRNFYGGNCETGQLTNKGFEQEVAVGRMYRSVYVDSGFLPKTFDPAVMYLRSDEADRCIQSLETMLEGFYPTNATSTSFDVLNINTCDSYYDNISPNSNLCPILAQYQNDVQYTTAYQEHYTKYTLPLYQKLSAAVGYDVVSWGNFSQIRDCLVVHSCHQQPIPAGVTETLLREVFAEYEYSFKSYYDYPTPQLNAQAGIGFLLQEVIGKIQDAVLGKPAPKFLMYSAHDTTLVPILNAYNQWNGVWARYASQMQIELYKNSTDHYIRMAYNGENLLVPGCTSNLCPWNTFYNYSTGLFPVQANCQ